MKPGDLVTVPRKGKAAMAVGEIRGDVGSSGSAQPYKHFRPVSWINLDVPRSTFDRDLLASFSAMMTICQINKPGAEDRVLAAARGGRVPSDIPVQSPIEDAAIDQQPLDLERLGRDLIATMVIQRFKGHDMARLVEALLKAQGYTTFASPPGPDKGIDILAAPGPLGFGSPRICVQVKSQESPVDSPTLNQ